MSSTEDNIVAFVDEQLEAIFAAPAMWGSNEAIEFQVIQLLEVRSVTLRPELEKQNPRAVLDAFQQLLRDEFPDAPPYPLHAVVEELGRSDDFIPLLRRFSEQIKKETQPENIFATHDLVLRLWMRKGIEVPRASAVSSYYDVFHRVLRAIARERGTRGRAHHELEEAIDFEIPDLRIVPANGKAAQVVLPLDQLQSGESSRVKHALEEIVTVNEWAADPGSPVAALRDRIHEEGEAQRVAAQVLRLMPGEETTVQTVELGGRLIERPQAILIRPSYAPRMLQIIKEDKSERSDFDRVAMVRAVDIDQLSMRVKVDSKPYKCWLENAGLVPLARDTLGKRVRVMGYEYKKSGSTVIIVHEIRS